MPTRKVKGGWRYGKTGKIYPTKAEADKQGAAIRASQHNKKVKKKRS